jgi:hypothetical protein
VVNEPISSFHTAGGFAPVPTTFLRAGSLIEVSANGSVFMGLTMPPSVGGTSYRLSEVQYCISRIESGAFVNVASLMSDVSLLAGLQTVANDPTDRNATGCFTLVPNDGGTARSYGLVLGLAFTGATANDIDFTTVRTTWTPISGAADVVSAGSPGPAVDGAPGVFGVGDAG